ncbi:DivIVA domain-containing protein [Micromonospora robiginosa]|uniref:DivIVA domain-containing protein n=1 Tax=Micromonospora robiginosa TaxID=2749844 RepID=A0A7L6BCB8_9ACTN|nr:DivIVA domain-containing protein [Micromonospora ferruginea]QLQ39501.1 DivIVA domain-containing protein [Micromonospora ferruginea]
MAVYRSSHALVGPLTPGRVEAVELPLTSRLRRGYRTEDVDALLHRLAYELAERSRRLGMVSAENRRIKTALRNWQSERVNVGNSTD